MVKRFIIAIILLGLVGGGLVWFNFFRDGMIAQIFANMPQQPATVSTVEAKARHLDPGDRGDRHRERGQGVDLTVESRGRGERGPVPAQHAGRGGRAAPAAG
jgi:membrane fusion protein, multidrug efflux system